VAISHLKFGMRTDTEKYQCMRDVLSPKWMYSGHLTSLNFVK